MEGKLSPGILLIIAILATVFFIIGLLNLLVQTLLRLRGASRRRRRVGEVDDAAGEADGSPTAFQGQLGQLFRLHDAGVDQAFIDALPVFPYRAVVAARRNKDPSFDCAVCLCEFELDDALRLLPTCGHAFHVPCIDAWLLSHSTCPLCRGSVLAECAPASSPFLLVLKSDSVPAERDGSDPGDGGSEESPKADEEIVEIKLGKLRCVDGNVSARVDGTSTITGSGSGNLGQRRSLSMGSYEYVTDDHAALRVAVKTTPKRRPANSRSRRRHALSECDFGGSNSKKGAWEAAVREAAASADAGRCGASLNRDSFSVSKIWMVSSRNEDTGAAELAGSRRAVSFRSPAMAAGWKKHLRGETGWDVEAAASRGSSTVSPLSEETALHRAAGERQQCGKMGNHS